MQAFSRFNLVLDDLRKKHKIVVLGMELPPACSTFPSQGLLRWGLRVRIAGLFMISGAFLFSSCSDQPQELDERITQLQKELDRTQSELQATKQALTAFKEEQARQKGGSAVATGPVSTPPAGSSTALPSREALENSYMTAAKSLKKQLQTQLKDFSLDTCTLHHVELPSSEYPVTSKISLALHSNSGNKFLLELPVKADTTGRWVFPEVGEIVRQIENSREAPTASKAGTSDTSAPSRPRVATQQSSGGPTRLPNQETVTIQWPDSGGFGTVRNNSKTAPAAPEVQKKDDAGSRSAATPKNSVPADRDVLIKF